MNNIFVGQNDPLLNPLNAPYTIPNTPVNPQVFYQQVMDYTNNKKCKDWIGELDTLTKKLDGEVITDLMNNKEYVTLSNNLQTSIQNEIMGYVKMNLNNNQDVISNVKRQMEIINNVKETRDSENKKNMIELNDYMKNYSHLTFNEYKALKENGVNENNNSNNKPKGKKK